MPGFKFTMIFNCITGAAGDPAQQRSGGWSESVYAASADNDELALFRTLSQRRAALLPRSARISGWRIQQVDPSVRAAQSSQNFPGAAAADNDTDIPQMALAFTVPDSTGTHSRRMKLACIPDQYIVRGEFLPTPAYRGALTAYMNQLDLWSMRSLDFTVVQANIDNITAGGVMTTIGGPDYAIDQVVLIKGAVKTDGTKVSGQFRVNAATLNGETGLANWTAGATVKGKVRRAVYIYPNIEAGENTAVVAATRKVGRPSTGFRGRRSRRRR